MNCQRWNCMRKCVDQDPQYPAGIGNLSRETGVAFARLYVRGVETAIAFAGEQWAFLVQLSGAEGRRFHVGPYQRLQRCHWFHSRHVAVSCARKSSPCVLRKARNRLFMACWAIFSRQCRSRGCVGRILSRCRPDASHVGRTLSRRWRCWHAMRLYVGLARRAANRPQPGRSRLGVIAANEPPAHASCGGGRQYEDSSSNTQRNRCKRR